MSDAIPEKKELILQAAVKVFSVKGFHHAKVEEIAATAGIGKGTVYEYFKSKKELFHEIFLSFMLKKLRIIKNELSGDLTPKEALIKILEAQFNFVIKHRDIAKLMMNEHQEIDKDFKYKIFKLNKEKADLISIHVEKGIEQGIFRQVNPLLVSMVMEGMIHAIFGSSMNKEKSEEFITLEEIEDFLFDGLEKKEL